MEINNPKNSMVKLIESKEDGILSTNNVLARMWRIILFSYGLSGSSWQLLLDKYQTKMKHKHTVKGSANIKGNLTRQLAEDKLSWDGLINGLAILEFEKIEIELSLTKRGETRVVKLEATTDEFNIDEDRE